MFAVVSFRKDVKMAENYILDSPSTVPAKHTSSAYIILFAWFHPIQSQALLLVAIFFLLYRNAALWFTGSFRT